MYSIIQFIAYEINTTPDKDTGRYLGDASASKDIDKRCAIMKNAISIASKNNRVSKSSLVLKLFMAPEFFFRNTEGAYPIEQISKIMTKMKQETAKPKYSHWLFVLGTAIGYLKHEGTKQTEIFNIALVQKGGPEPAQVDGLRQIIIYKEYISSIDFLGNYLGQHDQWHRPDGSKRKVSIHGQQNRTVRPTEGSRDLLSAGENRPGDVIFRVNKKKREWEQSRVSEVNKSGIGGGSIFTVDGITFGLEVCLDHMTQRLALYASQAGENLIQVQLIPSAGMNICYGQPDGQGGNMPISLACINNGLIFNVDGIRSDSEAKIRTGGVPTSISAIGDSAISLSGISYLTVTHRKYFKDYGRIKVYTGKKFPDAQTEP